MSTIRNLKRFQRACEKRGSLEEKTKIFEENARKAKLAIDKELLVQVLQEENRAHDDAIKELEEKLQEENHAHDDAIKELEEKIADLEMRIKSSSEAESIPSETPPEPAQEMTEPLRETSTEVHEEVSVDAFQDARVLVQDSEVSSEHTPKKKKRGLFAR